MNATPLLLTLLLSLQADPADLLKKLGSEKVEEREGAERKLIELGESVRPMLKKAAGSEDDEVARRAVAILALLDRYASLDRLVARAREFGMPFPPADSPLVRTGAGRCSVSADGTERVHMTLAFLLNPSTPEKPGLVLQGPEEKFANDHLEGWVTPVQPVLGAEQDLSAESDNLTFPLNSLILTALQCKARGWNEFADILTEEGIKHSAGHRFTPFVYPGRLPPKTAFAYMAWAWFGNQLIRPDTDRSAIARHMKSLVAEEPKLDTELSRHLLGALDAALVPSKAGPGSPEALIDDLVNITGARGRRGSVERDPRELKVIHLGFEAVPALISHLDDVRLTRSVTQGFNNFPTCIRRLNEVVSDLLQGLAGDELGKDWLRRQQGYAVEKAAAEAWWKEARKTQEREYFAKNALGKKSWPEALMIQILGQKYPEELAGIYTTLLEQRPEMQSWPIAEQIGGSALPRERKIELFSLAGKHPNLEHRRAAFWELKKLDGDLFVALLVGTLEALPATPKEPYWSCPEGSFANLVYETDHPMAWEALGKTARRADVGLRLQYLKSITYSGLDKGNLSTKLKFLASFLDDATERDLRIHPEKFQGPTAGGEFKKLEVRNFAAAQIAYLVDLKPKPERTWKADQWAALRKEAQAECDRRR
jgi:hypothetical protein